MFIFLSFFEMILLYEITPKLSVEITKGPLFLPKFMLKPEIGLRFNSFIFRLIKACYTSLESCGSDLSHDVWQT